jgi:hypothetical protein
MRRDGPVRQRLIDCVALLLYLMLSLAWFGTIGDYRRIFLGIGTDPSAYIWFLNWWPWAISHGINPFISHYVWYPNGFNLTWAGSMPAGALLMAPVTWLAGAAVSFNVLTLAVPALSAWTGFLLARYLTPDTFSAFVGGYLFGFSTYTVAKMLGHLNLDLTFILPLLVLLVIQRVKSDISRRRFVAALSIALLVQLGLSTEIFATSCVCGAVTWVIFLAFAAPGVRRALWGVAIEIFLGVGIMAVLAAPFLFFVITGTTGVPAQINSPEAYPADLLNYFIPTEATRFGSTLFKEASHRFPGNIAEQVSYLGLPLILILVLQFRDLSHNRYLRPILVSLLAMVILSLGTSLYVAGVNTHLWLPWRLALPLPFIHQALPSRFSLYVALVSALVAALWLTAARPGLDRSGRFVLAVFACLCLLPNPAMIRWQPLPLEPFFEPQNVTASLGQGTNVIILPFGSNGPSMIWQWQSGMSFKQSGGYVGATPPTELAWPIVKYLVQGIGEPNFENDIAAYCVTHQVSAILVGPGAPGKLAAAVHSLNWPETMDHGMKIVHVPDPGILHFHYISGDYWPESGPASWMGREIKIVTHNEPMKLCIAGQSRPPKVGPVEITVANGTDVSHYQIGHEDRQILSLPANATATITASTTFVPARVTHNGDLRALSVTLCANSE